jgi:hypothetical protein
MPPKVTPVAVANPVPVTVTVLPPSVVPDAGVTAVTAGWSANVYRVVSLAALSPPAVWTVTGSVPLPAGVVASSSVGDRNVTCAAGVLAKVTVAAEVKPLPVTSTSDPPPVGPAWLLSA